MVFMKALKWLSIPLILLIVYAWYGAMDTEEYQHACDAQNVPSACYSVARKACISLWNTFETGCRRDVRRAIGPNRVATLIGPAVKKCTQEKFDKAFKYNRRSYSSEECESFFSKLDGR